MACPEHVRQGSPVPSAPLWLETEARCPKCAFELAGEDIVGQSSAFAYLCALTCPSLHSSPSQLAGWPGPVPRARNARYARRACARFCAWSNATDVCRCWPASLVETVREPSSSSHLLSPARTRLAACKPAVPAARGAHVASLREPARGRGQWSVPRMWRALSSLTDPFRMLHGCFCRPTLLDNNPLLTFAVSGNCG